MPTPYTPKNMKTSIIDELSTPTAENLHILKLLRNAMRVELRALIKAGLDEDAETDKTRDELRAYETAITCMLKKRSAKNDTI